MTRTLLWTALALATALPAASRAQGAPLAVPAAPVPRSADQVLGQLVAGNERFALGQPQPRDDAARLKALAHGERPVAIVLTCSDSRVVPELLFDQPLGVIHAIRVAGGVAVDAAAGSAELAVEQFDVPLLVVLGHTECGPVQAALEGRRGSDGAASCVFDEIEPAARRIRATPGRDTAFARTVQENIGEVATRLVVRSPLLRKRVVQGKLRIVTGVFDVSTGRVRLDEGSAGG